MFKFQNIVFDSFTLMALSNCPNAKVTQFTIIDNQENHLLFILKKIELIDFWHLY